MPQLDRTPPPARPRTYNNLMSQLQAQPWYHDSGIASYVAQQVQLRLGTYTGNLFSQTGPLFNTGYVQFSDGYKMFSIGLWQFSGSNYQFKQYNTGGTAMDYTETWAVGSIGELCGGGGDHNCKPFQTMAYQ